MPKLSIVPEIQLKNEFNLLRHHRQSKKNPRSSIPPATAYCGNAPSIVNVAWAHFLITQRTNLRRLGLTAIQRGFDESSQKSLGSPRAMLFYATAQPWLLLT
jgi:hypothetical protein